MKSTIIKKILFWLFLLCLMLPALQKWKELVKIKPLKGVFQLSEEEPFAWKTFFDGAFQPKFEKGLNDHVGFRNWFVRLNNQVDFSLFSTAHLDNVIVGKNDYLFEKSYIDSYLGEDYVGRFAIDDQLHKLKYLQDTLKKKNIDLIFVIAPGKALFIPEYLPDRFRAQTKTETNYSMYTERAKELGINLVDFQSYFAKMKDTASYPLYPKWSIHWSTYGYTLAADSLSKYIEKIRNMDMPDMSWDGMEFPDTTRNTDNDIGVGMNLIWQISFPKMAYPVIHYNHPEKTRPSVLTIADSYYNGIWDSGIPEHMFHQENYRYYNKELFCGQYSANKPMPPVKELKTEIEKNDVIILMVTERNLCLFPFGFIDNAYEAYAPADMEGRIRVAETIIKTDPSWYTQLMLEAKKKKCDPAIYIRQIAENEVRNESETFYKLRNDRIAWWEKNIWNNPSMLKIEVGKAKQNAISIQEMVHREGIWFFENECESSPKKMRILAIDQNIRKNEGLMKMESVKMKNSPLNIDEVILRDAFEIYHSEVIDSLKEQL